MWWYGQAASGDRRADTSAPQQQVTSTSPRLSRPVVRFASPPIAGSATTQPVSPTLTTSEEDANAGALSSFSAASLSPLRPIPEFQEQQLRGGGGGERSRGNTAGSVSSFTIPFRDGRDGSDTDGVPLWASAPYNNAFHNGRGDDTSAGSERGRAARGQQQSHTAQQQKQQVAGEDWYSEVASVNSSASLGSSLSGDGLYSTPTPALGTSPGGVSRSGLYSTPTPAIGHTSPGGGSSSHGGRPARGSASSTRQQLLAFREPYRSTSSMHLLMGEDESGPLVGQEGDNDEVTPAGPGVDGYNLRRARL